MADATKKPEAASQDDLAHHFLAYAAAEPLKTLEIGGQTYAIGELNAPQLAYLWARGERIAAWARGEGALLLYDWDSTSILTSLLYAGDQSVDLAAVRPHIRHKHIVAAGREYVRQAVKAVLANSDMQGHA